MLNKSQHPLEDVTLQERVIEVRRVARVVAGGKRLRFRVIVIVGNGEGKVGVGVGKAQEVPSAVRKAVEKAKKNLIDVPMRGDTIPVFVQSKFGSSSVILRPAVPGTGIIAGTTVRAILELAGYKDVLTKVIGSTNALNTVLATIKGLQEINNSILLSKMRKGVISND
ncbi:ribosomal protein S5 [Thermodesulfobium narugense DSM 14796]|uniref:Small ribosomal subunit protein uS5 n=1 Tax=Thermodesulfobium narugense DSM 14796 TaxID=747365 RepID=M1E5B3_9BACT|nr:30S ribosomal protein S5 [Thermodesulfobium narugense]AEE14161.1 ribosomal protein S5 [Thermodesulfobium narugense DSM 14796]